VTDSHTLVLRDLWILGYVRQVHDLTGSVPGPSNIQARFGLDTPHQARHALAALERNGYLRFDDVETPEGTRRVVSFPDGPLRLARAARKAVSQ
jgi:SOS-response transcriptional repressor LexA